MDEIIECSSCNEEFKVENMYDSDISDVLFCPYCGSNIINDSNESLDEDDDVDEDYRD